MVLLGKSTVEFRALIMLTDIIRFLYVMPEADEGVGLLEKGVGMHPA